MNLIQSNEFMVNEILDTKSLFIDNECVTSRDVIYVMHITVVKKDQSVFALH